MLIKKLALNLQKNRKLNIKQEILTIIDLVQIFQSLKKIRKKNIYVYENDEKDIGESKSFIESTLAVFNAWLHKNSKLNKF